MVLALPIVLLVAAGVVWAVVAFFTSEVNRVLKLVVALVVAAGIVVAALLIIELRTARIELVNGATQAITDVTLKATDGKRSWTETSDSLAPGASCVVSRMVPGLRLDEVTFRLAGKPFRHDGRWLAGWGERLVITVADDGTVRPTELCLPPRPLPK